MSSTSSTTGFNGSSTYAAQLQQIITHSVAVASLPMAQLQTTQAALNGRQNELQNIASTFSSMQAAVNALGSSTGVGAFSATVSDTSIATAAISSGVMAGTYSLNISSVGSQTNAVSQDSLRTVTDPSTSNVDDAKTYTLTLNDKTFQISNPSGTLTGLAQAINSSSANVQASVVNVGGSSSPDYRLSIQSLDYAPDSMQLNDGSTDLLTTLSTGSNVAYQINGHPSTPISSTSRSVIVSPGLSVQIAQTGTTQVTVAQSASTLANALSSFATSYNSIVSELSKNRGQNGGALSGDAIIYQLQSTLQNLANYSGSSGSLNSLADIGLSFDETGNLTFDQSTFNKAASTAPSDLLNFIGTPTSGGFLQKASSTLSSIMDSSTGVIASASQNIASSLTSISSKISDEQAQVTQLQQKLTLQMANVDSTISALQQQLSEVTDLFDQMQTNQRALSG